MSVRWASLLAVLVLAAVHLLSGRLRPGRPLGRGWVSAAAGISIAYVFVHLLPLLSEMQAQFLEQGPRVLLWLHEQLYLAALLGLLATYALDHLAESRRSPAHGFWIHAGWLALYNAVIGFYASHLPTRVGLGFATVAFAAHLHTNDRMLERDYDGLYARYGRWLFAFSLLAAYAVGALAPIPDLALIWLFAALAGAILLSSLNEELPGKQEGKLGPFVAGALGYTALLLAWFYVRRQ